MTENVIKTLVHLPLNIIFLHSISSLPLAGSFLDIPTLPVILFFPFQEGSELEQITAAESV